MVEYIVICTILNSTCLFLSLLSVGYIAYRTFRDFNHNLMINLTCFAGSLIIAVLSALDFLRSIYVLDIDNYLLCLYFIATSMTAVLSCYVLLQVGTNFYQEFNIVKTMFMYAPIIATFGTFGVSVFTAVQLVWEQRLDLIFEKITLGLSLLAAFLTFLYAFAPLYNIRKRTKLQPERTAVSIIHLYFVILFFIAHFAVYCVVILSGGYLDMRYDAILRLILLLIFPGCLFKPPRVLVKKIKRSLLGVEELTIGGEYRPEMLPKNYEDTMPGPKILHPLAITTSDKNSIGLNDSNSSYTYSLSPSSTFSSKGEGYTPLNRENVFNKTSITRLPPPSHIGYLRRPFWDKREQQPRHQST